MILLLDNFDSFTYNLVDFFHQLGAECKVIRNDVALHEIIQETYEAVVLSPGPETPARSGNLMQVIDHYKERLPILGICLGHQALGQYFGASLQKANQPMHGKICRILCEEDYLFQGINPSFNVVLYHSLILKELPAATLSPIAQTDVGEFMALKHVHLPIRGIQFHPEAYLTENGLIILQNWLAYNKIMC